MLNWTFNHHAAYTAVRIQIEVPTEHENLVSTGTGFLLRAEVPLGDGEIRTKLLLISNRHVLRGGCWQMTVHLNRKKDDGTPAYGNVKNFIYKEFSDRCFEHPDENVDLACVDVSEFTHTDAYINCIDSSFLTPIDYEKVALGSDVLFVGFPNGIYDMENNLPLVRKGTLASMPNLDFNGKGEIVIDAQIFAGSSGSPVFIDWDETYKLLGVISGTMRRRAAIEASAGEIYPTLGLGIVVKQRQVRELIDHTVSEVISAWESINRHQSS